MSLFHVFFLCQCISFTEKKLYVNFMMLKIFNKQQRCQQKSSKLHGVCRSHGLGYCTLNYTSVCQTGAIAF